MESREKKQNKRRGSSALRLFDRRQSSSASAAASESSSKRKSSSSSSEARSRRRWRNLARKVLGNVREDGEVVNNGQGDDDDVVVGWNGRNPDAVSQRRSIKWPSSSVAICGAIQDLSSLLAFAGNRHLNRRGEGCTYTVVQKPSFLPCQTRLRAGINKRLGSITAGVSAGIIGVGHYKRVHGTYCITLGFLHVQYVQRPPNKLGTCLCPGEVLPFTLVTAANPQSHGCAAASSRVTM